MDTGRGPLSIRACMIKCFVMTGHMKITARKPLGNTGIQVPPVIYGTSYLGNLYRAIPYKDKLALMKQWFQCTERPVVIDSAGKYGAGLALEVIGRGLEELGIPPEDILISNKLGWYRVPLETDEPAFEPGAWAGLDHDCIQIFGYDGIVRCFEQGNELLGERYSAALVSVHDPDEYLMAAGSPRERDRRLLQVLESYRALFDLKDEGKARAVGIGSKQWTVIRELYTHVPFDWVMLANSFTIFSHPPELMEFMEKLESEGVGIINSALFHGGFLTGGSKFDYRDLDPGSESGRVIYRWRDAFHRLCEEHGVVPADACLHFGLSHPSISGIALNTSRPERMERNAAALQQQVQPAFWEAMKEEGLIDPGYAYV
jgi:D-threo-aldose 1-dehydrogenase